MNPARDLTMTYFICEFLFDRVIDLEVEILAHEILICDYDICTVYSTRYYAQPCVNDNKMHSM